MAGPARAGVNSFGFGGANAHVVLEEPPHTEREPSEDGEARLLTVSARSEPALTELAGRYRDRLRDDESLTLTDVCYTAALRRADHDHRLAVVAASRQECIDRLGGVLDGEHPAEPAPVASWPTTPTQLSQ
ncbi:MAG: hypothetical protein GEU97_06440 [Actinophytocola sp.]|nr:hypothetical protein [Actinophytocola sp.]